MRRTRKPMMGIGRARHAAPLLILLVPFEVFDALVELVGRFVIEADESVGFLESLIDISPVFGMADVDVGQQTLGYELKLMSEAFDQHAGVVFDLFQSFVHLTTQLLELPVNALKALVNAFETTVMPV